MFSKLKKFKKNEKTEEISSDKRVFFLRIFFGLALLFSLVIFVFFWRERSILRFGFITDVHSYSKSIKSDEKGILGYEVNWRSLDPMNAFMDEMKRGIDADFVIENGDYIKGSKRPKDDFLEMEAIFSKIDLPRYHVLGNHEVRDMTKKDWLELTGYEKPYYYFDEKDYRMIVLDANFFAVCGDPEGDFKERLCLGHSKIEDFSATYDIEPGIEYYPGCVNVEQMNWLRSLLENTVDKKILVFVHHPLIDESEAKTQDYFVFNKKELRGLFEKYGVLAVFSGHIEELCHIDINGVKYFVLPGFHRKNSHIDDDKEYFSVFSDVKVKDGNIEVEMFYKRKDDVRKEEFESFVVDQSKSYCGDKVF